MIRTACSLAPSSPSRTSSRTAFSRRCSAPSSCASGDRGCSALTRLCAKLSYQLLTELARSQKLLTRDGRLAPTRAVVPLPDIEHSVGGETKAGHARDEVRDLCQRIRFVPRSARKLRKASSSRCAERWREPRPRPIAWSLHRDQAPRSRRHRRGSRCSGRKRRPARAAARRPHHAARTGGPRRG